MDPPTRFSKYLENGLYAINKFFREFAETSVAVILGSEIYTAQSHYGHLDQPTPPPPLGRDVVKNRPGILGLMSQNRHFKQRQRKGNLMQSLT